MRIPNTESASGHGPNGGPIGLAHPVTSNTAAERITRIRIAGTPQPWGGGGGMASGGGGGGAPPAGVGGGGPIRSGGGGGPPKSSGGGPSSNVLQGAGAAPLFLRRDEAANGCGGIPPSATVLGPEGPLAENV